MQIDLPNFVLMVFLLVAVIQVIYWIFFLVGIKRLKLASIKDRSDLSPISVIVASHNEYENLKSLIPTLMEQDHPEFEIVIVNDRSSDESYDFLIKQEQVAPKLKVVHIQNLPSHISGKKYALTMGIKAAKYKQVLLTDADCRPASTSWISSMASGFRNGNDIVLGFSYYEKLTGILNYFIRFETLKTGIEYLASASNKLPYMGVGRNLAYKKDLFIEKKGFYGYQHLIGGDDDLFVNAHATSRNTAIVSSQDAVTVSKPKTSWASFWHQKIRHSYIGKYYTAKSKLGISLFNITWIFVWVLGITGLILSSHYSWIIYALAIREILVILTFYLATKRLGIAFEFWGLFFLDLFYSIYYIFVGIKALLTKTITWS